MLFIVLFLLLFILILCFIIYNIHVKATVLSTLSTDIPLYSKPPIFTNTFYDDLSLAPDDAFKYHPPTTTTNKHIMTKKNRHYNKNKNKNETKSKNKTKSKNENNEKNKDYYLSAAAATTTPQVYHIFKNIYSLKAAKQQCRKRGGRLATHKELTQAYKKGASWCNWGWVANGNAYMPNKDLKCNPKVGVLQGSPVQTSVHLGVNCFGIPTPAA